MRQNQSHKEGPIFVVGSPRSGTSILTWCLGQHPNILPQEESNWMGDFAVHAAAAHAIGSARLDRAQLSAIRLPLTDFLAAFGSTIDSLISNQREAYYAKAYKDAYLAAKANPKQTSSSFMLTRDLFTARREAIHNKTCETGTEEPESLEEISRALGFFPPGKRRWVDGTPEYSLQLPALRKLFPAARFIHVVRDVDSVVKSLLRARDSLEFDLVKNEQDAYDYWLRTVRACLEAEKAWGFQVVRRIRYLDMVERPRATLASILRFVSEPFSSACLGPLAERINSSRVPPDYDPTDPATDPTLREEAEKLSATLMTVKQTRRGPNALSAATLEETFRQRVRFEVEAPAEYRRAQGIVEKLQRELYERGVWNRTLDQEIAAKNERIIDLQKEVEDRSIWALKLKRESDAKDERIAEIQGERQEAGNRNLDQEIAAKNERIIDLKKERGPLGR